MATIVYGPVGCGKTRKAERLREHFGCTRIVDEWDGKTRLQHGDLALCIGPVDDARAVSFTNAMTQIDGRDA